MKTKILVFCASLSVFLSGCWTLSETEYPDYTVARLPKGKSVTVYLSGFEAEVQRYVVPEGHETMKTNAEDRVDGPFVKASQNTNIAYSARSSIASHLIDRAAIGLERKGFTIRELDARYTVEVKFTGPVEQDYNVLKQLGYAICTIFTMERNGETWEARLKIIDEKTRKTVFRKKYVQPYDVTVWGPIPIASPACSPKITCTAASSWALTALTDAAIADASAFLADKAK